MNSLLIFAALGVGYAIYISSKTSEELRNEIRENNAQLNEDINNILNENTVSRDDVTKAIEIENAMLGISSISDKYMNCAAGIVWKNTSSEDINLKVDSAIFSVGGYEMSVGANNLTTITIPAKGTKYQALFAFENHVLWDTKVERTQVRVVIGEAQGHPGKEGRDIWGKANFDAILRLTASPVSDISKVPGKQIVVTDGYAFGRYYGSTALKSELIKWVRSYIGV